MYGLLWRVLPGPIWLKIIWCIALFVGVIALCFNYIFPTVAPYLPFNDASVGDE